MITKRKCALIPRSLWWSCALLRFRWEAQRSKSALLLLTPVGDILHWPLVLSSVLVCDDATVQAEWQWHSCCRAAGCLTAKCVWDRDDSILVDSASWDSDLVKPGKVFHFLHCFDSRGKYCTLSAWRHEENSQNIKSVNMQGIQIVSKSAELCLDLRISHRHEKHRYCICSVFISSVRPQHLSNYMAKANDQSYHSLL